MLTLFHSNRQEQLIAQLAEITSRHRRHPFSPEIIVTQSPGMARWIAIQLAERLGIAANYEFPLPSSFFWKLFTGQFPELGETSGYEKPVLTWRIMKRLPELIGQPPFAPLQRYLQEEDERRDYQLARRIADVLDQYLIYRTEMVLQWEAESAGDDWQAMLWRELVKDTGERPNRAQLLQGFIENCRAGKLDAASLPERINLFGIPTLPPAYLELLNCLAQHTEVNLFLLNPCQFYWGDIEDQKRIARRRSKLVLQGQVEEDHHFYGNRLLASMGKQGRDFVDALIQYDPIEQELFDEDFNDTMLGRLQQDILELDEVERGECEVDASLGLHSCHSPMREVEILHDRLLDLFNKDSALQPHDVIIMTPDVEGYAPFIEAVFGGAEGEHYIPWTLSDRTPQGQHPVIRAFQQLLDVASGRFEASEVLSLLENPAILKRFKLDGADFERIRRWIHDSGIRWGLNERSRKEMAVNSDSHTWAFGLRRLLLGVALPADAGLYADIAPYPHIEGQAAVALGQLMQYIEALESLQQRLRGKYRAREWAELINQSLETFFIQDDNSETALQWVRDAMMELVEQQAGADYNESFGLEILRDHLNSSLNEALSDTHFLNGKLTFCTLLPMRSLPFKLVMMIGMNEGSFPRQNRPLGFDLIAQHPRRGDRSRREDDRYLFLEALLSARQALYISYVGRDIRDNSPRLPSVLVSELLDTIEHCYGKRTRAALITEHPMQAFAARNYLDRGEHYSYAADWLPDMAAIKMSRDEVKPFISAPLPALEEMDEVIDLAELIRFFTEPARAFLKKRLGIHFGYRNELLEDSEPFALDTLQQYSLKQELLQSVLDEQDSLEFERKFDQIRARGDLPPAPFDRLNYEWLSEELELQAQAIQDYIAEPGEDIEIDLSLGGHRLTGWLRNVYGQGVVAYRPATIKPRDRLQIWIEHLAYNALMGSGVSYYLGSDASLHFTPVANARDLLTDLVTLYLEGLQRPLHFYPRTSWVYMEKPKDIYKSWETGNYKNAPPGEGEDDYLRCALRGQEPLDEAFEELARRIYGPMLEHMEVEDA
ncbi:MAG: exodeoxyribonuclease V subunit gamma [Gammaproteobacteria bacterium]|nr:exodeoxyribonuclease V subunit gamma [Gammaproteobacteria bacterium]